MAKTHRKYKNTVHKNPFREDRPKSYRGLIIFGLSVLALTAVILAVVFFANYCSTVRLIEKEPGVLYSPTTGKTYYMLDSCYYATVEENEPYAECNGVVYYKIKYGESGNYKYIDPKKAIATVDEYSKAVFIYATEEIVYPDYTTIDPEYALVEVIEVVEYPVAHLDQTQSKSVTEFFKTAEHIDLDPIRLDFDSDTLRWIYFSDPSCPGIYYTLKYIESTDGKRYLHTFDRSHLVDLGDYFTEFLDYVKDGET